MISSTRSTPPSSRFSIFHAIFRVHVCLHTVLSFCSNSKLLSHPSQPYVLLPPPVSCVFSFLFFYFVTKNHRPWKLLSGLFFQFFLIIFCHFFFLSSNNSCRKNKHTNKQTIERWCAAVGCYRQYPLSSPPLEAKPAVRSSVLTHHNTSSPSSITRCIAPPPPTIRACTLERRRK